MNANQAALAGVDPAAVHVVAEVGRYGGDWRVEDRSDPDRARVLFATGSIFEAAAWVADLRRISA